MLAHTSITKLASRLQCTRCCMYNNSYARACSHLKMLSDRPECVPAQQHLGHCLTPGHQSHSTAHPLLPPHSNLSVHTHGIKVIARLHTQQLCLPSKHARASRPSNWRACDALCPHRCDVIVQKSAHRIRGQMTTPPHKHVPETQSDSYPSQLLHTPQSTPNTIDVEPPHAPMMYQT